jgi:hypothetical protein
MECATLHVGHEAPSPTCPAPQTRARLRIEIAFDK